MNLDGVVFPRRPTLPANDWQGWYLRGEMQQLLQHHFIDFSISCKTRKHPLLACNYCSLDCRVVTLAAEVGPAIIDYHLVLNTTIK